MPTLLECIVEAAKLDGSVTSGSVGEGSTTRALIDPLLRDTGVDEGFLGSAWILRPEAENAGDLQRQATEQPFVVEDGAVQVIRPWAVAPAEDETYYAFGGYPAMPHPAADVCWRQAVNDILAVTLFDDRVELVDGPTVNRFIFDTDDITAWGWTPYVQSVSKVFIRSALINGVYHDQDMNKNGFMARVFSDEGVLTVETNAVPSTGEVVMATVIRPYAPLLELDDETDCPLELVRYGAYWRFLALTDAPEKKTAQAWKDWFNRYLPNRPPVRVST